MKRCIANISSPMFGKSADAQAPAWDLGGGGGSKNGVKGDRMPFLKRQKRPPTPDIDALCNQVTKVLSMTFASPTKTLPASAFDDIREIYMSCNKQWDGDRERQFRPLLDIGKRLVEEMSKPKDIGKEKTGEAKTEGDTDGGDKEESFKDHAEMWISLSTESKKRSKLLKVYSGKALMIGREFYPWPTDANGISYDSSVSRCQFIVYVLKDCFIVLDAWSMTGTKVIYRSHDNPSDPTCSVPGARQMLVFNRDELVELAIGEKSTVVLNSPKPNPPAEHPSVPFR